MKIDLALNKKQRMLLTRHAHRAGLRVPEFARRLVFAYASDQRTALPTPVFLLTKKVKKNVASALKNYQQGKAICVDSFRDLFQSSQPLCHSRAIRPELMAEGEAGNHPIIGHTGMDSLLQGNDKKISSIGESQWYRS